MVKATTDDPDPTTGYVGADDYQALKKEYDIVEKALNECARKCVYAYSLDPGDRIVSIYNYIDDILHGGTHHIARKDMLWDKPPAEYVPNKHDIVNFGEYNLMRERLRQADRLAIELGRAIAAIREDPYECLDIIDILKKLDSGGYRDQ